MDSPNEVSHHREKTKTPILCAHCKEQHSISRCSKFSQLATSKRFDFAKQQSLCLNCLAKGHRQRDCPSPNRCFLCNDKHHTKLHLESMPVKKTTNSTPAHSARVGSEVCGYSAPVKGKSRCPDAHYTDNTGVQLQTV